MCGVQTAFYNVDGLRQKAPWEGLVSVLRSLGATVESFADVQKAIRERRQELWRSPVEPVTVAWQGEATSVALRVPASQAEGSARCDLTLETGERRQWGCHLGGRPVLQSAVVEGVRYQSLRLPLPPDLPCGYHRLTVEWKDHQSETLVISAPMKAYAPDEGRSWGVFLPLYTLRTKRDWGAGELSDLESLLRWVNDLGGNMVATLPLLAAFPDEASPYAPVSRLLWNELYVDISSVPELERCPSAQAMLGSPQFQREADQLRSHSLVGFPRLMRLKRRLLEELTRCFFAERSDRHSDFARFVDTHPLVEDYARFRAVGERLRAPWPEWPPPLRDGVVEPGDYDEEAQRYHLYAQWLAHEQMKGLSRAARSKGARLYLDLPLGAHPAGYDTWRERSLFAQQVSAGAPPDTFFSEGQNWDFHPAIPEEQRRLGYRYFIDCLRHHLGYARVLRIDHVMGLHRLYWIPEGADAREGVYVRYPAEELYAILSLESHRHKAVIVGEDLGTVPHRIRKAMRRHNLQRSYVVQLDETTSPDQPLGPVPAASVASLNTHDTPPFAAYWRGLEMEFKRGLLAALRRKGLLEPDHNDDRSVLRALLAHLATGPAQSVLVSLEDLWLETDPQNVPGTTDQHPNWRRKARHTLEEFRDMPEVVDVLRAVDRLRKDKVGHVASK
jgi:4-alpha-glucanotransferase